MKIIQITYTYVAEIFIKTLCITFLCPGFILNVCRCLTKNVSLAHVNVYMWRNKVGLFYSSVTLFVVRFINQVDVISSIGGWYIYIFVYANFGIHWIYNYIENDDWIQRFAFFLVLLVAYTYCISNPYT